MNTNDELRKYLEGIRNELQQVYDGNTTNDDGETGTFWDYFNDPLDYEYTIAANGDYLGVRVYVTLGGPNVWIDTRRGEIAGAWGTARADIWLPDTIRGEIDYVFAEYYSMIKGV